MPTLKTLFVSVCVEVVGKVLGVMVDGGGHLSIHNNAVFHLKKQGAKRGEVEENQRQISKRKCFLKNI